MNNRRRDGRKPSVDDAPVRAFVVFVLGLLLLLPPVPARGAPGMPMPVHDPDHVLVDLADASPDAVRRLAARHGLHDDGVIPGTTFRRVSSPGRSAVELAARLRSDAGVLEADLDLVRTSSEAPNDPLFGQQMGNWSIGYPAVWDVAKADPSVLVAVIDSGVDATHPDLAGRVLAGYDFVQDDNTPSDPNGHGTAVAGVIAARANNGIGIAGISWDASVLPIRVLDNAGTGVDSDVAAAITYAVDHGARILNLSLGGPSSSAVLEQAVAGAVARGAVIVAAAGNDGSSAPHYPAALPGVLAVAATDPSLVPADRRAPFSNYGPWISMAAPGTNIYTTVPGGGYAMKSGTSFSAPQVAGAAALLQAQNPTWPGAMIREALRSSALRKNDPAPTSDIGWGVLDLQSAVATAWMAGPSDTAAPEPNDTFARATKAPGASGSVVLSSAGDVDVIQLDAGPAAWRHLTVGPLAGSPTLTAEVFDAALDGLGYLYGPAGSTLEMDVPLSGITYLRIANRKPSAATVQWTLGPASAPVHYTPTSWIVSATPKDFVAGDLAGDGRVDLASLPDCSGMAPSNCRIELLTTTGVGVRSQDGFLGAPVTPTTLSALAIGDVDGDGRADVVAGASSGVLLYRGGALQATPQLLPLASAVYDVEVSDLDADGRVDIAASTALGGSVLWQGPTAWTTQSVPLPPSTNLELGDIDGDGRGDLVQVGCIGCPTLGLFRQTTSRAFAEERRAIDGPSDVVVADVTGDGRTDVALSTSAGLVTLAQATTGALVTEPILPTASFPSSIASGDANGDGRPDLVITRNGDFGVFRRTAAGGYLAEEVVGYYRDFATGPERLAVLDVDGDGAADLIGTDSFPAMVVSSTRPEKMGRPQLVASSLVDGAVDVAPGTAVSFDAGWALSASMVHAGTVHVYEDTTSRTVPAQITVDGTRVVVTPQASAGHRYLIRFWGTQNLDGVMLRFRTVPAPPPPPTPPPPPAPAPSTPAPARARSGYWMVATNGAVFNFGDAPHLGDVQGLRAGMSAVDLEPAPSGATGYWVVTNSGHVFGFGPAAGYHGGIDGALTFGESVTSISATPSGRGYWLFTTRGRVVPFGDAQFLGDMTSARLNAPVLDSIPTPSGSGYYMVAADGGIFTFGDAAFRGSMGAAKLNAAVQSLVPDRDNEGYWLVASDGGIFAFDAPFQGSMGDARLNGPITGMVRFGDGYLMVGTDGGIFNFSGKDFYGSLGDRPLAAPITSVAVLEA